MGGRREVEFAGDVVDGDAECGDEVGVVVGGVAVADRRVDEIGVNKSSKRLAGEALVGDAAGCAAEGGDDGGAVVAGEVEGRVEAEGRNFSVETEVAGAADEDDIGGEGVGESRGVRIDGDGEVSGGECVAEGAKDGCREDDVADALELDEENSLGRTSANFRGRANGEKEAG